MYPNAGDVQAPTPNHSRHPSAVPAHSKKGPRSASPYVGKKEDYGEYGSSLHPLERRSGHYSLSSDDLNQIVAQTASPTIGNFAGVPEEEMGYLATEEYAKAMGTATPREELTEAELTKLHKVTSGESTQAREGSQSPELTIHVEPRAHQRSGSHPYGRHNLLGKFNHSQSSLASEIRDIPEGEEYSQKSGELRDEHYRGTPILASDEVTKRGGTSTPHHQAAVSPPLAPRRTASRPASRAPSRPPSRGAVRESPAAVEPQPVPDAQVPYTTLEGVREHEPLFPDEDEVKDSQTALREGVEKAFAGRTSRSSKKFPSNDIWEDAPPSSHLSATVASPPPGLSPLGLDAIVAQVIPGEEPQDEESDRLGVPNRHKKTHSDEDPNKTTRPSLPTKTTSGKQRFPSRDIWEEAPDSAQLTATVSPTPANVESQSPVDPSALEPDFPPTTASKITTGPTLSESASHVNPDDKTNTEKQKPEIPVRPASPEKKERWGPTGPVPLVPSTRPAPRATKIPTKFDTQEQIDQAQRPSSVPRTPSTDSPTEKKTSPVVPERPKPAVPQRPVKIAAKFQQSPLAQFEEASSAKAPPPVKPKPALGGKIAALKANLALEQKLAAGPLAFKKKEEEEKVEAAPEEPKPLVEDVRKSRAKGPRGRKLPTAATPAVAPEETKQEVPAAPAAPALTFMVARTLWSIDDEDDARVVLDDAEVTSPTEKEKSTETEKQRLEDPAEANAEAQEALAKQVYTEIVDPPVVVEKPTEEEQPHTTSSGLISAEEHPEDAAPKGQSSLDTEKPAGVPVDRESNQAEAEQAVEEEGDGDWDVVNKV